MKQLCYFLFFLALGFHTSCANVVVTSRPIYFIVAPLLKGVDEPKLLLKQGHCAHHHHIKPSDIKLIQNAKMVFWGGPLHEPFIMKALQEKTNLVLFEDSKGFGWLSPARVMQELNVVIEALKKVYPRYASQIMQNGINFEVQLKKMHLNMVKALKDVKKDRFVTTYDFFNQVASDYGLALLPAMLSSPEAAFSPKNLKTFYALLKDDRVDVIIKDHHLPVGVLQSMIKGHNVKIVSVDAEGVDLSIHKDTYAILIERMMQSIVKCFL